MDLACRKWTVPGAGMAAKFLSGVESRGWLADHRNAYRSDAIEMGAHYFLSKWPDGGNGPHAQQLAAENRRSTEELSEGRAFPIRHLTMLQSSDFRGGMARILVIDDDPIWRACLTEMSGLVQHRATVSADTIGVESG